MNLTDRVGDEHLRSLGFGLAGAHRTGKTTVAKVMMEKNNCPFITSSASAIAAEMGIKVDAGMDLKLRLQFQERVLSVFEAQYASQAGNGLFITDRTPLDLAAYTVLDWSARDSTEETDLWLDDYVARCIDVTNRYFFHIGILQPGIPYHEEPGKPAARGLYQELVNTLVIGLAYGDAVMPSVNILPRKVIDVNERVLAFTQSYSRDLSRYWQVLDDRFAKQ